MEKTDHQVTKVKNEGRIAAGKQLVEWNRKNKEDLLKNQKQVNWSENTVPIQVNSSENQVLPSPSWKYSGLGIILLIGSAASYLFYKPKPVEAQPSQTVNKPKIDME